MAADIEVRFQYNESDLNAFHWNYMTKGRGRRVIWWFLFAMLALGITFWVQGKMRPAVAFSLVVITGLFGVMFRWMLAQQGKKALAMNPMMQEERQCRFNAKGFSVKGATFNTDYAWTDIQRVEETADVFLLFTSPMSAVILPKRAFDASQLAQLQQYFPAASGQS